MAPSAQCCAQHLRRGGGSAERKGQRRQQGPQQGALPPPPLLRLWLPPHRAATDRSPSRGCRRLLLDAAGAVIAVCSTHAWKSSTCVSEADRQAGGRAGKQARRPGRYMWPVGATVAPAPGAGRRLSRHGAALGAQSLLSANKANCGESGAGGTGRQPMASGAMSGGQVNALSQGCLCTSGYPPNETHLTSCRAGPSRARSRLRRVNY